MNEPTKKGDWVSNAVGSIRSLYPRRKAALVQGPPMATHRYTEAELREKRIIGVYLDEDIPEGYRSRPIIERP